MQIAFDRLGQQVGVGDRVLVLDVERGLLESLEGDERALANSMRGDTLAVIEITDSGYAVVEKQRRLADGLVISQSISLARNEMEKRQP